MICVEDYDMIEWELQRVCSFLRGLGIDDVTIGDKIINGTDEDVQKEYELLYDSILNPD